MFNLPIPFVGKNVQLFAQFVPFAKAELWSMSRYKLPNKNDVDVATQLVHLKFCKTLFESLTENCP